MRVSRFEDLVAWQRTKHLAAEVYRVSSTGAFARDFGLRDQMRRAAVSSMSNIAEGFERYSRAEFRHFLSIARGSAAELRSQLYLARELEYLSDDEFGSLLEACAEAGRLIGALRASLDRGSTESP